MNQNFEQLKKLMSFRNELNQQDKERFDKYYLSQVYLNQIKPIEDAIKDRYEKDCERIIQKLNKTKEET